MTHWFSDRLANRLPFYYGYVMIPVAVLLQISTSPGQTFAISAFTPHLAKSLELSSSSLALAYMFGTLLAAFPLSVVGPMTDRLGLRRITSIAVVALALACFLASTITNFAFLLVVFFLLRFLGQGSLSLLSANSISMWFRSRMGRVSAIMSIGSAVAFAWIPDLVDRSIDVRGWRSTYLWMGAILLLATLPVLGLLHRNKPEELGQSVDGSDPNPDSAKNTTNRFHSDLSLAQALKGRAFYILAAQNVFWAMAGTGVIFYLFDLCQHRKLSDSLAPNLFKTFGFSMLALQLLGGVLADKLALNVLLGIATSMLSVGLALAAVASVAWQMHGFACLFGAGQGLTLAVGAVVWVRYYGRKELGSIRGTAWSLTVAGSGCGPLLLGVSRDYWGSYRPAILVLFSCMVMLSVFAWFATEPRGAKVGELE